MVKNKLTVAVQAALDPESAVAGPLDLMPPTVVGSPAMTAADVATSPAPPPATCGVGIDVAKAHLDVATGPAEERRHVTRDETRGWPR